MDWHLKKSGLGVMLNFKVLGDEVFLVDDKKQETTTIGRIEAKVKPPLQTPPFPWDNKY